MKEAGYWLKMWTLQAVLTMGWVLLSEHCFLADYRWSAVTAMMISAASGVVLLFFGVAVIHAFAKELGT
jgi:cytochrome c oxidase subunit IV